jgi:hypothetical protein
VDRGWSNQPEKCLRRETTNRVIFHFPMPNLGTVSMLQFTECNACWEAAVTEKKPQAYRPPRAEGGDVPTRAADKCSCTGSAGAGSGDECKCGTGSGAGQ